MTDVFGQVLLPILVVAAAGYALRRRLPIDVRSINRMSIYVFSPALIFASLTRVAIRPNEAFRIAAFMLLFVLGIGLLTLACCRLLGFGRIDTASLLLCAMFMNSGNYGLPVSRFAFGEQGFQVAVLFFVVQATLGQTLAVYIAAAAGKGGWRQGLSRLFQMPQLYAVLAAITIRYGGLSLDADGVRVVDHLFRGIVLLSDAAVPLLLVVLGMQLAESRGLIDGRQVALGTALRLVLSVPLALGLVWMLGLEGLPAKLAIILTSMPTAVNMIILAVEFNLRPQFVANVVTASTVASVFSLTILLAVLG